MSLVKIRTIWALGFSNLVRLLVYKLGVKTGLNSVRKLTSTIKQGVFFTSEFTVSPTLKPNNQWIENQCFFGQAFPLVGVPSWHKSCLTDGEASCNKPWYLIADFDDSLGDIKGVWEASRFDWAISLAQCAKVGSEEALERLNVWINDWVENNPCYLGVNWKCGQEASIRVMHLALASLILEQSHCSSKALLLLIKAHLKRISPTIMYAIAQDNNHGTSEAAALYIGGSWLVINGDKEGEKWLELGECWLENRAERLIEYDGSFSQYSVTYHRVMLDTYSLVEVWRRKHNYRKFSDKYYKKLGEATNWLYFFTNTVSGDAPNIGANDGARLIPLTSTDFRDFRPSVQLANVLFKTQLLMKVMENTTSHFDG